MDRIKSSIKPRHFLMAAAVLILLGFITISVVRDRINLIVISIDTLRPDHLGCYGYERDTSPNIDILASEGVLFEDVTSQSPWTLPSQTSLFTSAHPSTHGLTGEGRSLDPEFFTLAEFLLEEGYRTAAFTGGGYMHRRSLFLDVHWSIFRQKVLAWLRTHSEEPFFLFIHCYDVHKPYDPPASYVRPFYPECRGEIISFIQQGEVVFKEEGQSAVRVPVDSLSENQVDHMRSHYDGEVCRVDEEVGILMKVLDDLGLRDKTLVVVTSDHGEQFLEHSGLGHRKTLYQEELAVPLIMRLPTAFRPGRKVKGPVSVVDILPTLLNVMSLDEEDIPGHSLVPLLRGERVGRSVLSEFQEGGLVSIRNGRYKLIVSKDGSPQLFDPEEEPGERLDVSRELPEIAERLFQEMRESVIRQKRAGEKYQVQELDGEIDEFVNDQLKALGYMEE